MKYDGFVVVLAMVVGIVAVVVSVVVGVVVGVIVVASDVILSLSGDLFSSLFTASGRPLELLYWSRKDWTLSSHSCL